MPSIKQYTSQSAANVQAFNTSRAVPQGIDFSGVAQGAAQIENAQQQLAQVQAREAARLKADETRMRVTNTMSEATVQWTERMQQAQQQAPRDAAGFTANTLKQFDDWTASKLEETTDEDARQLLKSDLQRMRMHIHADSFKFEIGQRNKALLSDFDAGLDSDRKVVMANPDQFQAVAARRLAAAQTLALPPDVREKMVSTTRESLAFDAAQGLVDRDAAGFLERAGLRSAKGPKGKQGGQQQDSEARIAADPVLSSLSPEGLRRTIDRASMIVSQQEAARAAEAERQRRLAEMAAERKQREADTAWSILSGRAMTGVATDPVGDAQLFRAIEGTPYAKEYQRLAAQIPQRQAVAMKPLTVQQAEIDQLIGRRNESGTNTALEDNIKFRKEVLASAEKQYKDSPLRATQQYGLQTIAQVDTSSLPALLQTIGQRVPQADLAGRQIGDAASPLLPEEVPAVQKAFAALPPDQRGQYVAELAQRVPARQLVALAKQIGPQDRALELAMKAGSDMTTQGRTVADLVFRGAAKMGDEKAGGSNSKGDRIRQQLRADVIRYIDGESGTATLTGQAREDIIESAILIDAGLQAAGSKNGAERAARLAIGGDMIDFNGRRIPVPPEIGIDGLRDRLMRYPQDAINKQAPNGYVVQAGGRPMGVPEFLANLPTMALEPAGRGRYFVRSGAGVAMNTDGRPIVIEAR